MKAGIIIVESEQYDIDSSRIKEVAKERKTTIDRIGEDIVRISLRSLRRNLENGNMKGETLLAISKALDCTPYYFLKPCPLVESDLMLEYWNYEIQTLSLPETMRNCLIVRGLNPHSYERLTKQDIDRFERFIIDYVNDINRREGETL